MTGTAGPTPTSELEARWADALAASAQRGLDGLVAISRGASSVDCYADVFYLTGHYGNMGFTPDYQGWWVGRSHSAVLLCEDREPILIVDGPDYRRDLVGVEDVRFALDFPGAVARTLRERGLERGRIGICGTNVMSARIFRLLSELVPDAALIEVDDLVEGLRVVKSEFELEWMRAAAAAGDAVVSSIMERALAPGVTEAQAVAAGYEVGVAAGVAFYDTAIASGPYSNYFTYGHLPSWSLRELQAGEIFHADCYGALGGYLFDFGRTCVVGGQASNEQATLAQAAVDAVQAGIAAIEPGVPGSAVFEAVHGHLAALGLTPASDSAREGEGKGKAEADEETEAKVEDETKIEFDLERASALSIGFPPHGHGLGLGWEWPWLLPSETRPLRPGMCLAIEAMPTKPGLGSSYFEQDVIVTDGGAELLTSAPARWW